MIKILVVDDDTELRANLSEVLQGAGYETFEATSGQEACDVARTGDFDIVLLDLMMPRMSGMDVLGEMKKISPRSKVVMITAFATVGNAVEAIKKGASDYIAKPFKINELLITVRRVIEEASFEREVKNLDLDFVLSSLSNPIRRHIVMLLHERTTMRLMELTRALDVEDHTKVLFHLKSLRESDLIEQNPDKSYGLTKEGLRAVECLSVIKGYLIT
jgi:DNA-binding NtrC family response regulator